jgi:type IV pilus assembly protein PilY1
VICTTTTTLADPSATCSVGVAPASPFDTTTACYPVVTTAMADYGAACVAGPTGVPGESVRCNLRSIDVLVADSACADSDVGGLKTVCTTSFGSGHKYSVTQTKTVTTTPFSGTVASGPDAVATTVTGPTNVDNVCYPVPQSFTAQPPVDIAGCGAWPCTQVTVQPGGSENSLADVRQYYYKTDLRPLMTNDPTKGGVPPAGSGPEDDKASHQHMTTFSIALGVSGTLTYQADYRDPATVTGDFAMIRTARRTGRCGRTRCSTTPIPTTTTIPSPSMTSGTPRSTGVAGTSTAGILRRSSRASARPSQGSTTGWRRERRTERRPCSLWRATTSPTRRPISRAHGKVTSRRG